MNNLRRDLFGYIDSEGRIKLPAKFHEAVKREGSVMAFCVDNRILVYTLSEFRKIEVSLSEKAEGGEAIHQFWGDFVRKAVQCGCDEDGCIQIPLGLMKQGNLKNRVMVSEFVDHVEIGLS